MTYSRQVLPVSSSENQLLTEVLREELDNLYRRIEALEAKVSQLEQVFTNNTSNVR